MNKKNNKLKEKVFIVPLIDNDTLLDKINTKQQKKGAKMIKNMLTNEEIEIFKMYASGKKIKYIATELNLSTKTVSKKMSAVSKKLNIAEEIDHKNIAVISVLFKQGII